jgi:hypothetical protein
MNAIKKNSKQKAFFAYGSIVFPMGISKILENCCLGIQSFVAIFVEN